MVIRIKQKINFGPFWVILGDINAENIENFKFTYVRGFNFVCSVTPNQSILVIFRKGVRG